MAKPRSSLGHDPLDAVLGTPPRTASDVRPRLSRDPDRKTRATFHLPLSLVEEARNATVALSGPPTRLTLARLAEDAIRREVERLREQHNDGAPFPPRSADLVGGRPIRS
jgi:hypothetical protein